MVQSLPRGGLATLLIALSISALTGACTAGSGSASLDGGSIGNGGTSGNPGTTEETGTGGTTDGGATRAVAQAIVKMTLANGASGTCSAAGQSLAIGTFTPIATAKAGDADPGGGTVELSCSVIPAASGFGINISFDVTYGGKSGLAKGFAMSGTRTPAGTESGSALVGFALASTSFSSTTCTFDPATVTGGAGGIAAGRYWTSFHCTGATRHASSDVCDIDGEVRVENCLQQ